MKVEIINVICKCFKEYIQIPNEHAQITNKYWQIPNEHVQITNEYWQILNEHWQCLECMRGYFLRYLHKILCNGQFIV